MKIRLLVINVPGTRQVPVTVVCLGFGLQNQGLYIALNRWEAREVTTGDIQILDIAGTG
jgi:hypothetical protein